MDLSFTIFTKLSILIPHLSSIRSPLLILPPSSVTVTKLREHWDETNSTVLNRKTQLDAMLADSHKLETKRSEVSIAWGG